MRRTTSIFGHHKGYLLLRCLRFRALRNRGRSYIAVELYLGQSGRAAYAYHAIISCRESERRFLDRSTPRCNNPQCNNPRCYSPRCKHHQDIGGFTRNRSRGPIGSLLSTMDRVVGSQILLCAPQRCPAPTSQDVGHRRRCLRHGM